MIESADLKAKLLTVYRKMIQYRNKDYFGKIDQFQRYGKSFSGIILMSNGDALGDRLSKECPRHGPSPLIRVWGSPHHTSLKLY